MSNSWNELSETARIWRALVHAGKKGAAEAGYTLDRVPGRGLSNVWNVQKDGKTEVASIRTNSGSLHCLPAARRG